MKVMGVGVSGMTGWREAVAFGALALASCGSLAGSRSLAGLQWDARETIHEGQDPEDNAAAASDDEKKDKKDDKDKKDEKKGLPLKGGRKISFWMFHRMARPSCSN
jgi:hypothetical protein